MGLRSGTVCVLPARGGSKRIPRKNIRDFHGRPLIAHTIATTLETGLFDDVVVSTDDEEIADVAREHGASVPFMRPRPLGDDHTGTGAVMRHAIGELESEAGGRERLEYVCLVYPTAVFVTADDLRESYRALVESDLDYVFAASRYPAPPQRSLRRCDDGTVEMVEPDHLLTRSQDLEDRFHDVGQFYWGRRDAWVAGIPVMAGRSAIHAMPSARVQDIDTPEDWTRAELIHRLLNPPAS